MQFIHYLVYMHARAIALYIWCPGGCKEEEEEEDEEEERDEGRGMGRGRARYWRVCIL